MPHALNMIRDDHSRVQELFRLFEESENQKTRRGIADDALAEIEVHSILEEELFYPLLRRITGDQHLIDEAEEDHRLTSLLAEELLDMRTDDPRFNEKFMVLAESFREHVQEEERELLSRAEAVGDQELRDLGEKMVQLREEALHRLDREGSEEPAGPRSRKGSSRKQATAGRSR